MKAVWNGGQNGLNNPSPEYTEHVGYFDDLDEQPFDASLLREGDRVHAGADVIEISRPVQGDIDGHSIIYGYRGPMIGQIDFETELRIDEHEIEELVTPDSMRRRLRSGPHYQEGLMVGRSEAIEFLHSYSVKFLDAEQQVAVEQIISVWRRRHP